MEVVPEGGGSLRWEWSPRWARFKRGKVTKKDPRVKLDPPVDNAAGGW